MTHTAVLYTKEGCCLCDRAKEVLRRLQQDFDLSVEEVEIDRDQSLYDQYRYIIPVVVIDGKHRFESKIAEYYLRRALVESSDQLSAVSTRPSAVSGQHSAVSGQDLALSTQHSGLRTQNQALVADGAWVSPWPSAEALEMGPRTRAAVRTAQAIAFWFARHWLAVANGINLGVLALSAAIPAMMAAGMVWLAGPLFSSYRLICHQLPYRSFFLFGYQMAMCERNVAIYGSMGLAGLIFGLVRGRLRPLSWRLYLALSVPIAVDGFTQLFGWRESTWELRLITGTLFGVATIWLAYPCLERFAEEVLTGERARGKQDRQDSKDGQDENVGMRAQDWNVE